MISYANVYRCRLNMAGEFAPGKLHGSGIAQLRERRRLRGERQRRIFSLVSQPFVIGALEIFNKNDQVVNRTGLGRRKTSQIPFNLGKLPHIQITEASIADTGRIKHWWDME